MIDGAKCQQFHHTTLAYLLFSFLAFLLHMIKYAFFHLMILNFLGPTLLASRVTCWPRRYSLYLLGKQGTLLAKQVQPVPPWQAGHPAGQAGTACTCLANRAPCWPSRYSLYLLGEQATLLTEQVQHSGSGHPTTTFQLISRTHP